MNWTLAEVASLRGLDAGMFGLFALAGVAMYYSLKYNLKSR